MGNSHPQQQIEYIQQSEKQRDWQEDVLSSIDNMIQKVEKGIEKKGILNEKLIKVMANEAIEHAKQQKVLIIVNGAKDCGSNLLINQVIGTNILPPKLPKNILVQIGFSSDKEITLKECNSVTFAPNDNWEISNEIPSIIQQKLLERIQQVQDSLSYDRGIQVFELLIYSSFLDSFPVNFQNRLRIVATQEIDMEERHKEQPFLSFLKKLRQKEAPFIKTYVYVSCLRRNEINVEKSLFEHLCSQLHLRKINDAPPSHQSQSYQDLVITPLQTKSHSTEEKQLNNFTSSEYFPQIPLTFEEEDDFWLINKEQAQQDAIEVERWSESICYMNIEKARRQLVIAIIQNDATTQEKPKFLERIEKSLSNNVIRLPQQEITNKLDSFSLEQFKMSIFKVLENAYEYKAMKRRFKLQNLINKSSVELQGLILNGVKKVEIQKFLQEGLPIIEKNQEIIVKSSLHQLMYRAVQIRQESIDKVEEVFDCRKKYSFFDQTENMLQEISKEYLGNQVKLIALAMTYGDKLIEVNKDTILEDISYIDNSLAEGIKSVIQDFKKTSLLAASKLIINSVSISFKKNSSLFMKTLGTSSVAAGISLVMQRMAGKSLMGCGPLGLGVAVGASVVQAALHLQEKERAIKESQERMKNFFEQVESEENRVQEQLSESYSKVNQEVISVIRDYLIGICSTNFKDINDQMKHLEKQEKKLRIKNQDEREQQEEEKKNENESDSEESSSRSSLEVSEPGSPLRKFRGENSKISTEIFYEDTSTYQNQLCALEKSLIEMSQEELVSGFGRNSEVIEENFQSTKSQKFSESAENDDGEIFYSASSSKFN